jgi:hypothetical protein
MLPNKPMKPVGALVLIRKSLSCVPGNIRFTISIVNEEHHTPGCLIWLRERDGPQLRRALF